MNLLLYMAPIAICLLLPASFVLEGNVTMVIVEKVKEDPWILALLFANATMAYLTNLTNFLVTKHTSALTLQVRPVCAWMSCADLELCVGAGRRGGCGQGNERRALSLHSSVSTSGVLLQVLGNAKGAVAAVVSVLVFKNPITAMGSFGFAVTIGGVVLYGEAKKRSK